MTPRIAFVVIAFALLTGCATTRSAGPVIPASEAQARQAARERNLRADAVWGLEGRIAVSAGEQGGSGRIEWRQDGERFDVTLSAPVTRQGWRLTGEAGGARLEGLEGGPRTGPDAAALLREATRWDIPVGSLGDWLRALPTNTTAAQSTFAPDGRLSRLVENGWTIDYVWPDDAAAQLPSRIDARREGARVRLAIDRWTDGAE